MNTKKESLRSAGKLSLFSLLFNLQLNEQFDYRKNEH